MNNILETKITKFCTLVNEINKINDAMECKQHRFTNPSDFIELNSNEVSDFLQKQEEFRQLLAEITKKQIVTIPFDEFKTKFNSGKLNIPPYHLCGIGTAETQEVIKQSNELKYKSYPVTMVDGIGECDADGVCYEITVEDRVRGCRNYILRIYDDNKFEMFSEELINKTITYIHENIKTMNILTRTKII